MRITVNDLAFEFPLYEKVRTMQAVKKFVSICRKLESIQCHNVERLVRTEIDKEKELYPTGKLYRIIREIPDKDERKYFLGLLVNREKSAVSEEACFIYKHLKSYACAAAREEALVSLETEEGFKKKEIEGSINGEIVRIKNISCEEHVNDYWSLLGIRIYEANVAKHKKDR